MYLGSDEFNSEDYIKSLLALAECPPDGAPRQERKVARKVVVVSAPPPPQRRFAAAGGSWRNDII